MIFSELLLLFWYFSAFLFLSSLLSISSSMAAAPFLSLSVFLSQVLLWKHGYFMFLHCCQWHLLFWMLKLFRFWSARDSVLFWHSPLSPWKVTCNYVATMFNCFGFWWRNCWVCWLLSSQVIGLSFNFSWRHQAQGEKSISFVRAGFSSVSPWRFARWVFLSAKPSLKEAGIKHYHTLILWNFLAFYLML